MKNLFYVFSIIFIFSFSSIFGDEKIDALINKFPTVISNYSVLGKTSADKKKIWSRSDLIENFSVNHISCLDNQILIKNKVVAFLPPEKSGENYLDYNNRVSKFPQVVYKWEFDLEADGDYLITVPTDLGTYGYLNNQLVMIISNGILTKKNSGKQWLPLLKGKNTLFLATRPGASNLLKVISATETERVKAEIIKRVNSKTEEDIDWVASDFFPFLGTLRNGNYSFIIAELDRINKSRPLAKKDSTLVFLRSLISQNNYDCYMIEKYIYVNLPELYFYFSKNTSNPSNIVWNSLFVVNNEPRTFFFHQLVQDGQKDLAAKYFTKCLELIETNKDFSGKEKFNTAFYREQFVSFFRNGRIREANEVLKITQEKCKPFPIPNFIESRIEQEDIVTLTQSFDETNAFQIKEALEYYDGSPDQIAAIYKIFLGLNNNLVKRNDGAVGTSYLFHVVKNNNEKLKNDFEKFCLEKIQTKLSIAKETRSIKLLEEVLEQFEIITPLPEIRLILMEEYFNCGAFLKALSQANLIFEKYPQLHSKIMAKLVMLENISELPSDQRKKIPNNFLKLETKILGQTTTIEKLNPKKDETVKANRSIGKLLKAIALKTPHSQYWNHPHIVDYQPIEPLFTKNNIIFNGASYLLSYSLKKNEIDWDYHSKSEYKKDSENGPHQKRFITQHSGNQLFMFTNRDNSGKKSVKSFDLKGNLLWDMSDQSISLIEEPLCTPISSQGKLFGLSYSNRETINVISYSVYDSSSGKLISRTPISYLPNSYRDETCRYRGLSWNTYTHDNHFTQDDAYVYGYSGSGIIFKADSNSGNLLWEKGFQKLCNTSESQWYWQTYGCAPSGFIKTYGETLLCYLPDIQVFTGLNKVTGEYIWKTNNYAPRFIHDRGKTNSLYFSTFNWGSEHILFKVNPQNGETIWKTATNGLVISGEGDVLDDKLYLPSEKSILVFDINTGKQLKIIPLNVFPLKIRCDNELTVVLTANTAFIFQNDGAVDNHPLKEIGPALTVAKIFEPDATSNSTISFENINLETTLKIPELNYTSPDPWKKTALIKTSKPFHFLLKCRESLSLFREGYFQKSGLYIPPEVIWFGQYPCYDIYEDTLYISENGKITASNIFTRETLWVYEYERLSPPIRYNWDKVSPVIAVTKQFIAFQTENQSIRILDFATRDLVLEIYSPAIRILRMEGNYIVTSNGNGPVRCFDISQSGKEIWNQTYDHYGDLFMDNGMLVFVRTNAGQIGFYDLKTGALKVQASGRSPYIMNRFKLDDTFLYAYGALYDAKTGKLLEKYQSGTVVVGGGYIGFFKFCGQEGNYIENGKEYAFKTKGTHNGDNYHFSAIRKGNRITFFSFYYAETFEIVNDKLVSIAFTNITGGNYGNHSDQANMDLFVLDNSLLEIRKDDMYFYRNFDPEFNYEKIKSFRVENKRKFNWPFSELYPEVEVTEKNWISYYGQKPNQKLSYLAFGDETFAYLKFHLTPSTNKDCKNTLYISADSLEGKISIIWDIDNWKNAQCSFNVNDNTESWKEIDIQGNVYLFIKIRLLGAFPNNFKNTMPNFNIEMRQMTGSQNDGSYRIGGAYHGILNQLPWLNYTNDEGQSIKDFSLRTALYENKSNFYPQGDDLIVWLKDRRRFKSVENNISLLSDMLEKNAKSYCCVNILTALLLEEVQLLKIKQPDLEELSEGYAAKIFEIVTRLNKLAISKGINKEWADFALSFWTIEVFPHKFSHKAGYDNFSKPYYGVSIKTGSKIVKQISLGGKSNLTSPYINQPFIEWIMPGLIPNFPQFLDLNMITLDSFGTQKTGLGKMVAYSPSGAKEFCNRKGKFTDVNNKLLKDGTAPLIAKESFYFYQNQKFECFNPDHAAQMIQLSITLPSIKSPAVLKNTGQTAESIMSALENLPSDNNNGLTLIDNYIALSGKTEDKELITVYGKWLDSLRYNTLSTYNALNSIWHKNQTRKDNFDFINNIIKESKLPLTAPRRFFIDRRNVFTSKESRSVLGPFYKDLITKPESSFNPTIEYKTVDTTHKFNDVLEPKLKGGNIYISTKITVDDNEKVFLFARAINNYGTSFASNIFSIWLNNKVIVQNATFLNYDDYTFFQKISLNKGENIVLIKITDQNNFDWGNNYSICIGDVYGAPIKGIEMKPVHK